MSSGAISIQILGRPRMKLIDSSSVLEVREQAKLELRIPRSKSQRFSDGSGSRSGSRVPSDDEEVD